MDVKVTLMKLTFYGQNCFHIALQDKQLLVDPFISDNPLSKDKVAIDSIEADYILLTHAHEDHVLDAEAIATRTGATIVSNYEIAMYYQQRGIEVHPMNHGGKWQFDFGVLKMVQAVHTSSFADGTYGGQPAGFVLSADGHTIYIAGDTSLTFDMKLLPLHYQIDVAILPIGDNFTMGITDAVIASDFIECDQIIGCHYDTFGFIEIDHDKARNAFDQAGKTLHLLAICESFTVA
jgi:L-ascorbate metabolism protein UlaG (beta-lactamase superfamily)